MRFALALALLSLVPCGARADAIGPPPECPPEAEPIFCHGPETCGPRSCISSSECAAGEHCVAIDLCVTTHSCGGIGGGDPRTHVYGRCDATGACSDGTCSGLFVCSSAMPEEDAGVDASSGDAAGLDAAGIDAGDGRTHAQYGCDCHCSVGAERSRGATGLPVAGTAVIGVALVALRSRVRRRRHSQSTSRVSG